MVKSLFVIGVVALLGVAQTPQNPAYTPFIGTWNCSLPALGSTSWTAVMTVSTTGSSMMFVSKQTSASAHVAQIQDDTAYDMPDGSAPQMAPPSHTVTAQQVVNHYGPDQFTVSQNPQTRVWTETAPDDAFDKTGTLQPDGTITFAAPAPRHERFKLGMSEDGKSMKMLWYLDNTNRLNFASSVIECKR